MTPAVSVLIATHNYGRFLGAALASVCAQTFGDFEVIVVDDGSTDATADVVRPFLADRRVRYHWSDHVGQSAAKNLAVRLARAPLLAFLDADDVWLPGKLEQQVARFADPALGVVYTRRRLIDEDGQELEYRQPTLHRGRVVQEMFRTNFICFSSALVRAQVFEEVGLFDEGLPLAIDYDLWLRVALHYRFDYVDEPLVLYRTGHASLSRRGVERMRTVNFIMRRFLREHGREALLDPADIRAARAETYCHLALAHRQASAPLAALAWYVRTLAQVPGYVPAWRGLMSLPLPEALRRRLRRALGKPPDWSVRQPVPK